MIDQQMRGRRDLPVWIDVESIDEDLAESDPRRFLLTGEDVWEAKRELERRGYHVPGIYTGQWYWERMPGGEPSMEGLGFLWVSHYGNGRSGRPADVYAANAADSHPAWAYPLGDRRPDLLQFGSRGRVAGFTEVDINAFRGSVDELHRIFTGRSPNDQSEEDTMALTPDQGAALNDTKHLARDVRAQLTGTPELGFYPGWAAQQLIDAVRSKGYNGLTVTEMLALLVWGTEDDRAKARQVVA